MFFSAAKAVIEMPANVIIRPLASGWEWIDPAASEAEVHSGLPVHQPGEQAIACTLLIPAEQVFLGSAHIATRNKRQLALAAPFAVEEQLAEDPELLHFAVHRESGDELVQIAAISREYLRKTLDELQASGLNVHRVVPDALLIPWNDGELSVLLDLDRALVRSGNWKATVIEAGLLESWLPLLLADLESGANIISLINARQLPAEINLPLPCSTHEFEGSTLHLLAEGLAATDVNLLQAEFAPGQKQNGAGQWKWPAVAAGVAAILALLVNYTELQKLESSSAQLEQAIELRFREAFPQVQRIQDPLIQAGQELRRLRGGVDSARSDFFRLVSGVAASISAQPDLKLTSLRYRNQQMQQLSLQE